MARHYPPEASGGARRPYLFTQALRDAGHRVTIVSPFRQAHPDHIVVPHLVSSDYDRDKGEPSAEEPQPDPTEQSPLRNIARNWLLWPEPEIRWARRVARHLESHPIRADWLMTTSPPESLHIVGPRIKAALGCRWLAEFRDTWTVNPHRAVLARSGLRRSIERTMAQRCLRTVDALTAVSEAVLSEIRAYAPDGTPEHIIDHFSDPPPAPKDLPKSDLNIVHSGGFTLSDRRRKLDTLLTRLDHLSARRTGCPLHLHIAGQLSLEEKTLLARREEANEPPTKVTAYGALPLAEARALQAGADALLLLTPEDSHALPGKFAEYRQTRLPILYQGGGDWLSLIDAPDALQPLDLALLSIRKGDRVPEDCPPGLNAAAAAQSLTDFLGHLTP
ncbi:glycosyltransferase [Algimonas porphyrae]|uniref:glycosyltransferase n=1 Tax=Algimonas porphyrae TaxID=1128113 RepID=UPI0024E0D4D2|nr:glycosyltransferase [Algimonas porphyrae]